MSLGRGGSSWRQLDGDPLMDKWFLAVLWALGFILWLCLSVLDIQGQHWFWVPGEILLCLYSYYRFLETLSEPPRD